MTTNAARQYQPRSCCAETFLSQHRVYQPAASSHSREALCGNRWPRPFQTSFGRSKRVENTIFERSFWNEGTWNSCILLVAGLCQMIREEICSPKLCYSRANTSRDYLGRSRNSMCVPNRLDRPSKPLMRLRCSSSVPDRRMRNH